MRDLTRATYGCCHAPVVGGVDPQHKCNLGRGGGDSAGSDCRKATLAEASAAGRANTVRRAHHPAPSKPPGRAAEDAMADALIGAGYVIRTYGGWLRTAVFTGAWSGDVVREFPVGLLLAEPRRFRADFFHPASRTVVELEGGAHGIQRQRRGDILREQLLTAAGLRVVRVLPEQVKDGTALALVRAAIKGGAK